MAMLTLYIDGSHRPSWPWSPTHLHMGRRCRKLGIPQQPWLHTNTSDHSTVDWRYYDVHSALFQQVGVDRGKCQTHRDPLIYETGRVGLIELTFRDTGLLAGDVRVEHLRYEHVAHRK